MRDIGTAPGSAFTSAERWVAVMLADHINAQTREAWPSIRRIAALTALSPASVKRALARQSCALKFRRIREALRLLAEDPTGALKSSLEASKIAARPACQLERR